MRNYMDSAGYAQIQAELKKANELYAQVYHAMNKQHVLALEAKLDSGGLIEGFRQKVVQNKSRLMTLQEEMKRYLQEYEAAQAKGNTAFSNEYLAAQVYGTFGTLAAGEAIDYTCYQTWTYAQSDKSFLSDYNDVASFMNTSLYQSVYSQISLSEWSNYELYLDALLPFNTGAIDSYTEQMLDAALASMLESIPGHEADSYTEILDTVGIDDLDKWMSLIKTFLSECAKNQDTWQQIKNNKEFQELLKQYPLEEIADFLPFLEKTYNYNLKFFTEDMGSVVDAIEQLDVALDCLHHCFVDYSAQIAYLDAIENALLNAGFAAGRLQDRIDALRTNYQSDFAYAMDKVSDYVAKQIKGAAKKQIISGAAKYVPLVKDIDLGLKIVDTAADIIYADDIKAVKGLGGLMQYDQALSTAYEKYVDMMKDGVASAADMAEADRIYTVLKATKIQEYTHMLSLCEGRDPALFDIYNQKYYELTGKSYNNAPLPSIQNNGGYRF